MSNKMDDGLNLTQSVVSHAKATAGEADDTGKKPKTAVKQARKRSAKTPAVAASSGEEVEKIVRKPRAPRAKKVVEPVPVEGEILASPQALEVKEFSPMLEKGQRDDSHANSDLAPQDNGENAEQRPQEERRGRGLRAVVSRTRRKNAQKQTTQQPQEEGAKIPRQRDSRRQTNQPNSGRVNNGRANGGHASDDGNICFEDIVSGRFDDGAAVSEAKPKKRVLAPELESPKLHKVLAQAGMGSRLEMEQLILEGRISVNAEPAHIGQRIQYGDQVRVNGKPIRVQIAPPPARVLAYHKPTGEIVTHDDPQDRPTVFRRLPRLAQGKWLSIGRLDINTEGLLLFTNSGDLANSLMHPRFSIEREYAVRVLGGLSEQEKENLLRGVELEDGRAQFKSIEDGGGEGANQWYKVVITEGRNREVRRMIESLGHAVSRLIRIRYGAVTLPSHLRQGVWAELSEDEMQALGKLVGGRAQAAINPPQQNTGTRRNNEQRGRGNEGRGGARTDTRTGARNNKDNRAPRKSESEYPDPMKTSLGYIQHDAFISPSAGLGRNRGRSGSAGGGSAGGGFKRRGGKGY